MRPSDSRSPRPHWGIRALLTLLLIAILFGADRGIHAALVDEVYLTLIRIGIFVILAASLNLVNGVTGQFSLGHAAFMVIGAYAGGLLSLAALPWTQHYPGWHGDFLRDLVFVGGLVGAALVAGFAGLLIGLPTLRLRGDYLAIATLGFGEIVRVLLNGWDRVGGATGISGVPGVTNLFFSSLVAIFSVVMLRNLQWSGPGRDLMAVREDEVAAAAVGVDVVRAKVMAFTVAAAFAGMAGVLLVHLNNGITPTDAGFMNSIEIVVMVVLGGMGSLTGSILGAAILVIYRSVIEGAPMLSSFSRYENVIYPVLLIGLMLVRREGLLGSKEFAWKSCTALYTRWRRSA